MVLVPYYLFAVLLLGVIGAGIGGLLGVEPIKEAHTWIGWGATIAALLSLSVQPLTFIFQVRMIHHFKKSFGLVAFFCAFLHVLLYELDRGFSLELMKEDFFLRSHIRYGIFSFIILGLMATTSNKKAQKIMKKNWKRLHRFIYVSSIFMGLHVLTSKKSIVLIDLWLLGLILILLIFRIKKIGNNLRRFLSSFSQKETL